MSEEIRAEEFDKLDIEVRVQLILAAVQGPVSKELVFNIFGLNTESVHTGMIQRVSDCLSQYEVQNGLYRIVGEEKEQLAQAYDLRMADAKIAEYGKAAWKRWKEKNAAK